MSETVSVVPRAFVWRRLHSLTGLWLVIFLIEHLLTNSQAALLLGENGKGFVRMVNALHNLPYLEAIEIFLLGFPIAIHLIWGIRYALTSKSNSRKTDGSKPSLRHGRSRAFTWQRITSWILLVLLIAHIVKFRFLEYPKGLTMGTSSAYFVKVRFDNGLYSVGKKLDVTLFDQRAIAEEQAKMQSPKEALPGLEETEKELTSTPFGWNGPVETQFEPKKEKSMHRLVTAENRLRFLEKLESFSLHSGEVVAVADNFGTATLLSVRDTFKSPLYVALYTIFVLAAVYHGFNGLWTFMITWGLLLRKGSQESGVKFCLFLMFIIGFLGLAAIWGTYFFNLRH